MENARWIRGFTWFGPSERNTLCPWREYCIGVCMVLFKLRVELGCSCRPPGLLYLKVGSYTVT
jgi:hypothetical protein